MTCHSYFNLKGWGESKWAQVFFFPVYIQSSDLDVSEEIAFKMVLGRKGKEMKEQLWSKEGEDLKSKNWK